jgi:hypothetical protein
MSGSEVAARMQTTHFIEESDTHHFVKTLFESRA